jgi:hypothetical protein
MIRNCALHDKEFAVECEQKLVKLLFDFSFQKEYLFSSLKKTNEMQQRYFPISQAKR